MVDKLGRYALTGESKNIAKIKADKYVRLVTFFSTSLTNKEFILRIYIINNLNWALQEVLRDEKKIGGILMQTSDPFQISHSISSECLSICISNLNHDRFNCKHNINFQDVPLNHIWNSRSHLLHCSFTFERTNYSQSEHFECDIRSFLKNSCTSIDLNVNMSIKFNLSNVIF